MSLYYEQYFCCKPIWDSAVQTKLFFTTCPSLILMIAWFVGLQMSVAALSVWWTLWWAVLGHRHRHPPPAAPPMTATTTPTTSSWDAGRRAGGNISVGLNCTMLSLYQRDMVRYLHSQIAHKILFSFYKSLHDYNWRFVCIMPVHVVLPWLLKPASFRDFLLH